MIPSIVSWRPKVVSWRPGDSPTRSIALAFCGNLFLGAVCGRQETISGSESSKSIEKLISVERVKSAPRNEIAFLGVGHVPRYITLLLVHVESSL